MNRSALLKMLHAGARRAQMDEATRRDWMKKHVGKRSAADCSDEQLSLLVDVLLDLGALDPSPHAPLPPTGDADRPTQKQWRYALDLSKELGMSGAVRDPALISFCKRVCKVDNPRFLDREGMASLITGLEAWRNRRKARS